jgi:hypothetical protein
MKMTKIYSEGDFFLKDAEPSPPHSTKIYNEKLRVFSIQKSQRLSYPMQKFLQDNNDNVP